MPAEVALRRRLGLGLLVFYGMGTIIGAGIYVLIGEVARSSGLMMPWAFLVAGVIAGLTGACYAELSTRFPEAAGAALYVDRAFGKARLSVATGALLLLTGIVSAATISKGFVGYLNLYVALPPAAAILGLCLIMAVITCIGIEESATIIAAITVLEVAGLLIVIAVGGSDGLMPPAFGFSVGPVMLGAFLAFYAFIGFEDIVNLAEEVREPERDLPRSIMLSLGACTLLYLLVTLVAVRRDLDALADSTSPLALLLQGHETAIAILGIIGVIAISNGALTQIIMSSRVLYGMARRGLIPALFARLNPVTQTPVLSTVLVTLTIALCAIFLPLATLARITSAVMLVIFILVNLSLLRVRRTHPPAAFRVWWWIPWLSLLVNVLLLGYQVLVLTGAAQPG